METYRAIGEGCVYRLVVRDGLTVAGPDAATWLQGQVSQDLDPLEVGGSRQTLVLSPQGKLEASGRLWRTGDEEYLFEVESGYGERLSERLHRFRLRVKVELSRRALSVLEVRGPKAEDVALPGDAPVTWPGLSGFDRLVDDESAGPTGAAGGSATAVERGDEGAFEAARIEAGMPRLGRELDEATIPQEAGEAFTARTVSFTKGCYTGQELVARLDARGSNTPRRLRGVVLSGAAARGDRLYVDGAAVGELTSVAYSPGWGRPVGLAYAKRSVLPPCAASVGAAGVAGAEIRSLPLGRG
ncbi:MAG: YgfZ/GcvT domain-containing protein [Acidimicrobiales bacterium]